MSRRYWDLDWAGVLPWKIGDVNVEISSLTESLEFFKNHYHDIFGRSLTLWYREEMTEAKQRFISEMDLFAFRREGKTIGLAMGHPSDWSTYYVRLMALLPEHREQRISTQFEHLLSNEVRRVGVNRFEAECSPSNRPMVKLFVSQGYHLTATTQSERFGTSLRFTKFLNPEAECIFRRQFLSVPVFGRSETTPAE